MWGECTCAGPKENTGSCAPLKFWTRWVVYDVLGFSLNTPLQADMIQRNKQARCRTELEILTLMKHPNIVRCFGTFRTEKFLYFIMESASPYPHHHSHSSTQTRLLMLQTALSGTALAPSSTSCSNACPTRASMNTK